MAASGVDSLMKQGQSNSGRVMDSVQSQINTIAGKRWDKNNAGAKKADTTIEQLQQYRARLPEGDPRIPAVEDAIRKASTSSGLVSIDMGGASLTPGWMSEEEKAGQGIASDTPIWIDAKGVPKVIAKKDVDDKKTVISLRQMEDATTSLNKHLANYDPNTWAEMFNSLADVPPVIANAMRDATERTINADKKTWQEMVLRSATGAVINPSEYEDYETIFFPQSGETPAEWERKAQKRHAKENAFRARSGEPLKDYVSPYKKKGKESKEDAKLSAILEKYK